MKRFLGFLVWGTSIVILAAPIVAGIGQSGCGGCYGKSCACADGTTQPTDSAPCSCPSVCSSHGGECTSGNCTGTDAGKDAAPNDAAPNDAAVTDATKDGGDLQSGDSCDLQNDQCASGLKCCTEPTHIPDASTHDICAPIQEGGVCPMYP